MSELPHYPGRKSSAFVDLGDGAPSERAYLAPHTALEDGRLLAVHPACSMMLSEFTDSVTGDMTPTIRMTAAFYSSALAYVPTADELRAVGQAMIDMATRMEETAAAAAAVAISRAREGGGKA